jgi:hypothetical protein
MASTGRREKLFLLGLLLTLLVLGLFARPGKNPDASNPRLTTYSVGGNGARALFFTLQRLGTPVAPRRQPFVADSLPHAMAVLAPTEAASPGELKALGKWLEAGGTMIFIAPDGITATDPDLSDPWLDSLGLVLESTSGDSLPVILQTPTGGASAAPTSAAPLAGIPEVEGFRWVFADSSRAIRRGAARLLRVEDGRAAAVEIRRGRGRVIAFSDGRPFTNGELRESGAALAFARAATLATAGGRTLAIDEYHHGHREGRTLNGAILRFLVERPLGHAILQLAGVGILLLLFHARRFGSPLPDPRARRRSPLEHVEALAGAYRQAGAKRTARRLLVAGLARRLGRRPPRDDAAGAELLDRLSAHPSAGPAATSARAEWGKERDADLVSLTRDVDRILEQLRRP